MQAFARNCRNQCPDVKGEAQAEENREARVPKRGTGADRFVVAMKARNGAGAKGPDQVVVWSKQLETGG
jgi:hypothetical protein